MNIKGQYLDNDLEAEIKVAKLVIVVTCNAARARWYLFFGGRFFMSSSIVQRYYIYTHTHI